MEIRKVQKSGNSSFVVSLPADWVKAHGVKKNAPVSVEVNPDGSISILSKAGQSRQDTPFIVRMEMQPRSVLLRKMISAYIAGYSTICLIPSQKRFPEAVSLASAFTSRTVGQEVVEESEAKITIKDVLKQSEFPSEKILRRMHALSVSILSISIQKLEGVDENSDLADSLEKDVDRLLWLIARKHHLFLRFPHLASEEGLSLSQSHLHFLTARNIERISDHALSVSETASGLSKIDREKLCKYAQVCALVYKKSMNVLFGMDAEGAHQVIEEVRQNALAPDFATNRSAAGTTILSSLKRISEYSVGICENLIDYSAPEEK